MRDVSGFQDCQVISKSKDMYPVVIRGRDVVCIGNVQDGGQGTALGNSHRGDEAKRLLVSVTNTELSVKEVRMYGF